MLKFEATEFDDELTLRELAETILTLEFRCRVCGNRQLLDLSQLIAEHGGKTRLGYLRRHVRCALCQ